MTTAGAATGSALTEQRRAEVAALLVSPDAQAAIGLRGTPVLLLDTERVRRQYRRLTDALPFVRFHYAVKALSHPEVIAALIDEGCGFDVATGEELALVSAVERDRIIHTHPIKKPTEIRAALDEGVRTFVIDNETELEKFVGSPGDVRLLLRLAYRNPHAKSDLSSKFGVGADEAWRLVERAVGLGIRLSGFSFHAGSQLDDPAQFVAAITQTIALMDRLEANLPVRFDTLDIGGGLPVAYDASVTELEHLAAHLRPLLAEQCERLTILAEPGRILVAEAMTLVTSVVGIADRPDGRWYYLDDGVYGSYSNVIAEDVHPLVFAARELTAADTDANTESDADTAAYPKATLAGPTCDSADVIARGVSLPDLNVGDLLVSPTMGAYTSVTATHFNGRPLTAIVPISLSRTLVAV